MKVIWGIRPDLLPASVVTLGMFDGVHRGHQALLRACRQHADRAGLPAVVMTYEPHPTQILHPEHAVRLLTPLPEKLDLLDEAAMDYAVIPEFTQEFSRLSPEQFIGDAMAAALHPAVVVAGYRTTFGHARAGTAAVLRDLGERFGFAVDIVEPIALAGGPISSSRIRQLLEAGDVALAGELLGRPYCITGVVAHGDGRGRQLGLPTANLETPATKLIPADGVYAVEATIGAETWRGVMNIGSRPTFDRPRSIEVHLLDFTGDLYGRTMSAAIQARLRDIRPFADAEALVAQIQRDIVQARRR